MSFHSSINRVSGIVPMYITLSVVTADGLVSLGIRLIPIMMPYSPLSLAVASNSLFQDVQLSHLSLGFVSEFVDVMFGWGGGIGGL